MIDDKPDIVFTLRVGLESDPAIQADSFDNPVTASVDRLFHKEANYFRTVVRTH